MNIRTIPFPFTAPRYFLIMAAVLLFSSSARFLITQVDSQSSDSFDDYSRSARLQTRKPARHPPTAQAPKNQRLTAAQQCAEQRYAANAGLVSTDPRFRHDGHGRSEPARRRMMRSNRTAPRAQPPPADPPRLLPAAATARLPPARRHLATASPPRRRRAPRRTPSEATMATTTLRRPAALRMTPRGPAPNRRKTRPSPPAPPGPPPPFNLWPRRSRPRPGRPPRRAAGGAVGRGGVGAGSGGQPAGLGPESGPVGRLTRPVPRGTGTRIQFRRRSRWPEALAQPAPPSPCTRSRPPHPPPSHLHRTPPTHTNPLPAAEPAAAAPPS
jgi:hypothetical protein